MSGLVWTILKLQQLVTQALNAMDEKEWLALLARRLSVMSLRTTLHARTTSYRYHEQFPLLCVFGCKHLGPFPPPRKKREETVSQCYLSCFVVHP